MRKKLLAIIILLGLISTLSDAMGFWRKLDPAPLSGAPGQAVVGTGDFFYLIHGNSDAEPQFWEYSAETRRWRERSTRGLTSGLLASGTTLAWDGEQTLYALTGSNGDAAQREFYQFNVREDQWNRLADTPHPQGVGNAMIWDGFSKRIYTFLGGSGVDAMFASYTPGVGRWETLPFPGGWTCLGPGTSLTSLGRFGIYAIRGTCDQTETEGDFAFYDLFRRSWMSLPSLPTAVGAGGSLLWIGDFDSAHTTFIYAISGGLGDQPGFGTYRYRLDDGRWEQLADHVCPSGAFAGNRLGYVDEAIHYWQGSPSTRQFGCDGKGFLQLLGL